MSLSVNTNSAASTALRALNATNRALQTTQLHITTGLRVNGPTDDASSYAIAQNKRGEIAGLSAVRQALATAESTVGVAINAAQAISDLLLEMKAKTVQGMQAGLDAASRTALTNDFFALRDQIDTVTATADFNGVNLVENGATDIEVLSTTTGDTFTVQANAIQAITLQFGLPNTDLYSESNATGTLTVVNNAIDTVSNALASFGSSAKRIDLQADFITKLSDIHKESISTLVDADLAEESATLQSLQIQQQLGVQALSIANAGPQSIITLFR